jgi:hypothetical protein
VSQRQYYQASIELLDFIEKLDGSYEQFARQAGCSGRTIARLRAGGRVNRKTVNSVVNSAQSQGFSLSRELAFLPIKGDVTNV